MSWKTALSAGSWAAGLFLLGLLVPLLGQLPASFAPVPVILAYAGAGRREGLTAAALASAIATLAAGWHAGAVFVIAFGLMAIGTGEGMLRRMSPERAVLLGGMPPVIIVAAALTAAVLASGGNLVTAIETELRKSVGELVKLYTSLGLTDAAQAAQSLAEPFVFYFVRLMPSIVVVTGLTQAACCYGVARIVLVRRRGPEQAPGVPLANWHAPDVWVWGLIAGLGFAAIPSGIVRVIGWNLAVIYAVVYAIQGIAVLEFWFKKISIPAFARAVLIAFVIVPPTGIMLIALGVVDIWADLRKVRGGAHPPAPDK